MWETRGIPLRNQLIARPSVIGRFGTPVAPLANRTLRSRRAAPAGGAHDGDPPQGAPMPRFAGRTFHRWARRHRSPEAQRTVVYFHGCGVDYYEPGLGEIVVAVLEHNGIHVVVPKQDCCGLPLQSNGNFPAARSYARRLVANLAPHAREGIDIVANSTSCGLMLKREAHEILGVDDEDLRVVGERTYDLCEYLLALHERGELRTDFEPLPLTVPYHAPCQQRGHGIGKPALDLLALVPELRVLDLDRECCGIAGTYGLKREKYEIGMTVGAPLFRDMRGAEADLSACDSETCRWQIEHATGVAVGAPGRAPAHGLRPVTVGIVLVSHSAALAEGVAELAREMAGEEVPIEPAGGIEGGALGTDAVRVAEAIGRADRGDGVLVLMDLGSAVLSAELARDLAGEAGGARGALGGTVRRGRGRRSGGGAGRRHARRRRGRGQGGRTRQGRSPRRRRLFKRS